ncbi:hypothetical protein CkaCkLH20_11615 [Colletotrichum karsti]|uniref:DUF7907 domain-containing protein n=1 Tax=Colletotrichum karsti TaxID=1095194 RepID=A0A9P6LEZ1_9PEZI|nr:uncharacterized protein CkaCkLH20_11615 [Colletotrichum karsti]KAF9870943.1 hypothetical protein CkaCkLH20_11615 [Colletotrichum karsti]
MIIQTLIKATILAATASAANIPMKRDAADSFRLWANTTYPDLPPDFGPNVQGYELSYNPNADCQADVTLVPAGQGSVFRSDGDTVGVTHFSDESSPSASLIIIPGGTSTVPDGRPIKLKCAPGTPGVLVTEKGLDYPKETGSNGGFMACKEDGGLQLAFFRQGQRPLYGCTVVQLLPKY